MKALPVVAVADYLREEAEMYEAGLSAQGLRTELVVTDDPSVAARRIVRLKPDAVVTRIMPSRFGITLTGLLRAKPALARTPIIVLTSLMQSELHDAARAAGASTVLLMPVDPDHVAHSIKSALRGRLIA